MLGLTESTALAVKVKTQRRIIEPSSCKPVIPLSLKRHLNQLKVVRRFNSLAEGQSELQYSKSELTLSIVYLLLPLLHYTNQMFHHSVALCMMVLAQQDSLSLLCYHNATVFFLFLFVFAFRIILFNRSVTRDCISSDKSFKVCSCHSIQGTLTCEI